jgi:hypothetical protein
MRPNVGDGWLKSKRNWWADADREICCSATLRTTNSTLIGLGGGRASVLRGRRLTTLARVRLGWGSFRTPLSVAVHKVTFTPTSWLWCRNLWLCTLAWRDSKNVTICMGLHFFVDRLHVLLVGPVQLNTTANGLRMTANNLSGNYAGNWVPFLILFQTLVA